MKLQNEIASTLFRSSHLQGSYIRSNHIRSSQPGWRSIQFLGLALISVFCFTGLSFIGSSRGLTAPFQTPAAFSSLSAASYETNLTPEGIAAGFGSNLAPNSATATTTPLPTTLNTISVTVNGVNAGLFFVSSGQINYLIPLGTAAGEATVNVLRNGVITHTGKINIVSAAPAIFTANANGTGVPAAIVLRVATNGAQTTETIAQLVNNRWQTKAINLGPTGERVFLVLFLCGIRGLPNSDGNSGNGVAENVRVLIGGVEQTPIFANKQGGLVGVDQINVEIPRELLGRGKIKATVLGGSFSSLEVEIEIAGAASTNPPTVTSFTPALATASETLTITGAGFSTVAANNLVRVNGLETVVESASATQLTVRVPYGAEAGRVVVRTTTGESSSNSDVGVRTTISGLATDTNGNPLPGVEVSYGSFKVTTRNDGTYLLRDVPAGLGTLKLDPSKLPLNPPMQPYSKIAGVTLNRDNLQSTTALQTVSGEAASIQTSTGSAAEEGDFTQHRVLAPDGTITTGNVTFTFADNTVGTFPADVTDNRIYLTVLNNSRTPAPLPAGIFSSTIAMLSPFGVKLAPGGKLTFPNTDGLAANAQARLYKLDQTTGSSTLGQFIDVGVATVSTDGQRIETGTNAITETSIYFAALRRPLTTVTGRVVDSDNTTPVRRALVMLRGQQTFTDGNGSFTLRNIPVPANNLLSLEASFVRPTGRTDSVTRNNIAAVVNGLTSVKPNLVLSSPTTQPNRPPSLVAPTLLTATEGQTRNIPILVSDPDSIQPVQVTLTSPNFVSIVLLQNIANIRIAPPAGSAGTYPLTLRATDNQNATTTLNATLIVTANRAPVLFVPLAQTANVGQQLAFNVSATDPDISQTLTLTATNLPTGATFTQIGAATGRFTWVPTANQGGNFTVTFNVADNGTPSLSNSKTVTITVASNAGTVSGTVRNAATGTVLAGVTLAIAGTNLTTLSASDGRYTLTGVPVGTQTLTATTNGFSSTQVTLTVVAGQTLTQNISLSPVLTTGQLRITLNWNRDANGAPFDLDAHLTGPTANGCFEVYYGDQGSLTSAPFALLEVDNINVDGTPPTETVRIAQRTPGTYRFYVENFSEEAPNGLSLSRATVQVFNETTLLRSFTVGAGTGQYWTVFELNGSTGALTEINRLSDTPPTLNCGAAFAEEEAAAKVADQFAPSTCVQTPPGLVYRFRDAVRGTPINYALKRDWETTQSLTALLWVKNSAATARVTTWFNLEAGAFRSFLFSAQARPAFTLQFGNGTSATLNATRPLPTDEWVQLIATWDSRKGRLLLYQNGVRDNAVAAGQYQTLWWLMPTATPFEAALGGQFGEAQLYNRALTHAEIRALFQAGAASLCR